VSRVVVAGRSTIS